MFGMSNIVVDCSCAMGKQWICVDKPNNGNKLLLRRTRFKSPIVRRKYLPAVPSKSGFITVEREPGLFLLVPVQMSAPSPATHQSRAES